MRTLASYAVQTLGLARLGILYPDDAYGRSFMTTFTDEATRAGATVVRTNAYRPGQPSFAPQTAAVRGVGERDGIQAVFIPDGARHRREGRGGGARRRRRRSSCSAPRAGTSPPCWPRPARASTARCSPTASSSARGTPSTTDFVARFRALNGCDPTRFRGAGLRRRHAGARGRSRKGARTRGAVLQYLRAVSGYRGAGSIRLRRRRAQTGPGAAAGPRRHVATVSRSAATSSE